MAVYVAEARMFTMPSPHGPGALGRFPAMLQDDAHARVAVMLAIRATAHRSWQYEQQVRHALLAGIQEAAHDAPCGSKDAEDLRSVGRL
jgi:hypothetical protein